MKLFLFIGDGIGDLPIKSKQHKTPLELASTPAMDSIARDGASGLFLPFSHGTIPRGASVILSMLGIDPNKVKRGPLEAIGAGIELMPGDVALLGRFVHLDEDGRVEDIILERDIEEGAELAAELDEYHPTSAPGTVVRVKYTSANKVAIVIKGEDLSPNVSDIKAIPGLPIEMARPLDGSPRTIKTMRIINECVSAFPDILNESFVNQKRVENGKKQINFVTMESAGTIPQVEDITRKYDITGAIIAGDRTIRGVFGIAGFEIEEVEGATGTINTNTENKIKKALESKAEFVVIHYKAPIIASMEGDLELKIKTIEQFDNIIKTIMDNYKEAAYAVLVQRNVSVERKQHLGLFTPFAVRSVYIPPDCVKSFSEKAAADGLFHIVRGQELLHLLLYAMGRPTERI